MAEPTNPYRVSFFMCGRCRNQVLSSQNYLFDRTFCSCLSRDLQVVIFNNVIFGENAANVWVDTVESSRLAVRFPAVDVLCNVCERHLGYQYVKVEEPKEDFQRGRFLLYKNQMLYWNGSEVVYADTLVTQQPVDTPLPVNSQQPVDTQKPDN